MADDWEYATAILEDGTLWDHYPVSPEEGEDFVEAAQRDCAAWNADDPPEGQTCVVVRRVPARAAGEWEVVPARENVRPEEWQ